VKLFSRPHTKPVRREDDFPGARAAAPLGRRWPALLLFPTMFLAVWAAHSAAAQIETVAGPPAEYIWVSHGRLDGHLALSYSPAGAFSPDSSQLAVVSHDKVVLMGLAQADIVKELRPRIENVTGLEIESANFLSPTQLFLLANGYLARGSKGGGSRTPEMAFRWDTRQDTRVGKVDAVGVGGGFKPARYFPTIHFLGLTKQSDFDLWNPLTGRGARVTVSSLTRPVNLFTFSPDGHWLIVAQIEGAPNSNPVIIRTSTREMADSLRGEGGAVLGMAFSRDSREVLTASSDGKVRIYSAPGWKLLQTLSGHHGPVHWADFSADGRWVVSAGEDKTVRVWSAEDGKLLQTLSESQAPVLTAAFSPDDRYIAASTAQNVLVWQRTPAGG
jgi:WD40 repeat protein